MADLVVGLSKTAVQLLADKVKNAIKEEAEQWKIVQRDLVFITGEFEMMQSFLDTVSEEHVKNRIVRTWVRQVRDLSNDVEDNIDFVLHLDPTKKSWWLRLVPSCSWAGWEIRRPLVDEAVAETTLLRARVVDVSKRNIRYNLIADSAPKPTPTAMDLVPVNKSTASPFDVLINAVKNSGPLDLAELITRDDQDLHVVSVCGTEGDLVKVAIVRKVYSDSRIHEDFQCRAWVKLMHPFNPHEFLRSLLTQFFTSSFQEQQGILKNFGKFFGIKRGLNAGLDTLERVQQATESDLIKEFAHKESNHRYLIVLEDLSTMVQWDAIRSYLPERRKGSRIVVLTHHPVVASQCTGEPCRFSELEQFSPGHSVNVYYKEGLQHDKDYMREDNNYDSLCNVIDPFGRHREVNELSDQIQEGRLISVYGKPGVGKSVIVRCVYHKHKESYKFMKHAWINICHPFSPTNFACSLLMDIHSILEAKDPIQECRHLLHEHKCLIVIDGLQSKDDWDWIKSNLIQHGHSGSCIIIITSDERVAKHCAVSSTDTVYNVQCLDPIKAKILFQKVLKAEEYKNVPYNEVNHFLSKCGGLPRVLTTVATYLDSKPHDMFQQEMRHLSNNFMQELSTNAEFESLRGLLAWMHSYLDSCPLHLKKFMLYLSIFPHDIIIRRRRLIRRWIAEGYSKGTDSNSTEKYVERIFDEVVALSIMQPVLQEATKVIIGYRVNGFFREYILSRPVEETIFFPVEVSALEKQGHGRQVTGVGLHLAIGSTWETDRVLFESLDLSRLRSMTLFHNAFWSFFVSDGMRVLRVLDLENARCLCDDDLETIGKLPSRLKLLSLRGQSNITQLPDSVGDLVQLQTLDIRGTKIRTLPPFITKLRKLQYIRAGTTIAWTVDGISSSDGAEQGSTPSSGSRSRTLPFCLPNKFLRRGGPVVGSLSGAVEVPRGIRRLKALQTLSAVHVNTADGESILDEFMFLGSHLKKLEVYGISGKQGRLFFYYMNLMTHLESLSLQFERNNQFVGWKDFRIPTCLRSLKMMGPVEQLPWEIDVVAVNLGKLTLEMTNALLKAEVLQQLGRLPSLRTLRLRVSEDAQHGELQFPSKLQDEQHVVQGNEQHVVQASEQHGALFSKLQVLEIACKSKLDVSFQHGAMEKLEQLKLHCFRGSKKSKLSGLQHLVSLKQVWLLNFFDNALKEALQQQLVEHPKIPPPKLMG